MKKALTAVVMGLLVVAIGASLSKAVLGLATFMVMSVVCTGGVALVVWVPLLIVIGTAVISGIVSLIVAVIAVIKATSEKKAEGVSEQKEAPKARAWKEEIAIDRYLDRAKFYGLSHGQILAALKTGGWSDAEIQAAYGGH